MTILQSFTQDTSSLPYGFCMTQVFISEEEYATVHRQQITNLQEIIEEPVVYYMIAPSTSSPEYQLALVVVSITDQLLTQSL